MAIRLVVGLGNPGPEYEGTRHNVGFAVLDALANQAGLSWQRKGRYESFLCEWTHEAGRAFLFKPQTYMNLSGRAVALFAKDKDLSKEEILVVHDDLDLPVGTLKAVRNRGAAGHNGVQSLVDHLGGQDFCRIRFGIGRSPPGQGQSYVLSGFKSDEKKTVDGAIELGVKAVLLALRSPWEQVVDCVGKANK